MPITKPPPSYTDLPDFIRVFMKLLGLPKTRGAPYISDFTRTQINNFKYAAMDQNRDWFVYDAMPSLDEAMGDWVALRGRGDAAYFIYLGRQDDAPVDDWTKTLIKL